MIEFSTNKQNWVVLEVRKIYYMTTPIMENRKSDYVDLIEGNIHSWITRHSIKQINKPFFTDNHQKCG